MSRIAARCLGALLYGGLLSGAIAMGSAPALATDLSIEDRAALNDLRSGDMEKLVFHAKPRDRVDETFRDKYGNAVTLADYEGKVVVLNFWATWCPPCRAEMPSIDRLSKDMADEDLEVLALSMDRFDVDRITSFFDEIQIENLRVLQDRTGVMARKAGVLGLPVTVVLDRQGREIARLQGEAEWDSADVKAILTRIMEMTAPEA